MTPDAAPASPAPDGESGAPRRPRVVMDRLVRLEEEDGSFDLDFWQAHTTEERWSAAWELVRHAVRQGRTRLLPTDEPRLQRSAARLYRRRR